MKSPDNKNGGGVMAVEKEKTLAERQLAQYGHVTTAPFAYTPWGEDHNLYTLPPDQLREVEHISDIQEREELAVRLFLENKWRAYWERLKKGIERIKRKHLLIAAYSLVSWVVMGLVASKKIAVSLPAWTPAWLVPYGWALWWGVLTGSVHALINYQILISMSWWQLMCLLPSLTGIGACVQILFIYFTKCRDIDEELEIEEPIKHLRHPYDPFEEVQIEYIRQKYGPGLSNEELRIRLEAVGRAFYAEALGDSSLEKGLVTYVREGLALYRALTPLTEEEMEACREEILKKASQKLKHYHSDVQEKVYDLLDAYLNGGRIYGRVLAGPPGTGKTELAKMLGPLFPDGQCVEIKLGGRSPAELEGDTEGKKGYFLEAFLPAARAGKKVRVICFDEMEKALDKGAVNNRELLTTLLTLENGEYRMYIPYYHAHFVVSALRFYPVNTKEELEVNEALLNRLPVIDVPGYTAEAKHQLYTDPGGLLEKMLASMRIDPARKDDPEVLGMLKELIDKDEDPGLRTLEDQASMALSRMNRAWRTQASSAAA